MNSWVRSVNRARLVEIDRIVAEDRFVLVDDHVTARPGWDHDRVVGRGQQIERVAGERTSFVQIAAVEGGLATTRLPRRTLDRDAKPFEHRNDRHAGFGEEPIDETGDEELNPFGTDGHAGTGRTHDVVAQDVLAMALAAC